ncbi:L-fucose:H+ symporter permease [Porphyromonadaceae bacterium]
MKQQPIIPGNIVLPFALLTTLFFAWALPNNLTDTMLAAFKRIMSLSDSKTAWIQVVCYLLGYGCFAIPGAVFIKKYSYKSGVMLGLGSYAIGTFMFYPALLSAEISMELSFSLYLLAILILFAGLSILETSTNSYVCAIGPEETAIPRLNFAQSFNPFGSIFGVVISQVFILSQLNTMSAIDRASLPEEELARIQGMELSAVTTTYMIVGFVMLLLLLSIRLTKMPNLKEDDKGLDIKATFGRLFRNKNYMGGIIAQFFNIGAQIAVWSFIIRYAMQQLNFDAHIASLGDGATTESIIAALRGIEPIAAGFYTLCEKLGLDVLLPRTAEQAGATYYIMSLVLFVMGRFICTFMMRYFSPRSILIFMATLGAVCCIVTVYGEGPIGVYALMGISGCMSLTFPTIYGMGIQGLGEDTKMGGAGMVMAIAGAAVLTQIQGIVSDQVGSIELAYWVPAFAFMVVAAYGVLSNRLKES